MGARFTRPVSGQKSLVGRRPIFRNDEGRTSRIIFGTKRDLLILRNNLRNAVLDPPIVHEINDSNLVELKRIISDIHL